MERLLTTEEVADLLRVEPVTVRRLVLRGDLTAYKIAGEYRFASADVTRYIQCQRVVVNVAREDHIAENVTERTRKILARAQDKARELSHGAVGPEHLLLALLGDPESVGGRVLSQHHLEINVVGARVAALHPAEDRMPDGELRMTPRAEKCMEVAVQEARALGHHYLGTEHLLLGLLRLKESIAGQILVAEGITLESAREAVKRVLAGIPETGGRGSEQSGE